MKRLFTVGVIWAGCAAAWVVLGSAITARTSGASSEMRTGVEGLWGPAARQVPLRADLLVVQLPDGAPIVETTAPAELAGSQIEVDLELEHRRKGLLWFPTYGVELVATYAVHNPYPEARVAHAHFDLRGAGDSFDGFRVESAEGEPVPYRIEAGVATWRAELAAGETRTFRVGYSTRGVESWTYDLGDGQEVRDFSLTLRVNDRDIDYPATGLSPSRFETTPERWTGSWTFDSLITLGDIGVVLPNRINPGPLASRITFFAPVGLLFFFFLVALVSLVRGPQLHPMHYFFLGCSFFAFHLLLAYLVDHVPVSVAFVVSTVVSVGLAVGYGRAVTGTGFALRVIGAAQLVYLVLFSATFFLEGLTGLTVAVGAVITLAVSMKLSAGFEWERWTERSPPPRTVSPIAGEGVPTAF